MSHMVEKMSAMSNMAECLFDFVPSDHIVLRDGDFVVVLTKDENVVRLLVAVSDQRGYELLADEVVYAKPGHGLGISDYRRFLTRAEELIAEAMTNQTSRPDMG